MSENENIENGLKCSFFEKGLSLPFSFVHLPNIHVHSGKCFCTFTMKSVHSLLDFVHLVMSFVHLQCVQLVTYYVQLAIVSVQLGLFFVQLEGNHDGL